MSTSVYTQNQNQELNATDALSASRQDSNTEFDDDIQITDTLDLPTKQVKQVQITV